MKTSRASTKRVASPPRPVPSLFWLGQAGFELCQADTRVVIDPYLSDYLAAKYRGTDRPHDRLMPPPVQARGLHNVTAVLCTHRHGDHMDPLALPVLAQRNPACRFLVPRAELDYAVSLGLAATGMNADETIALVAGLSVTAIAAAHEHLRTNARGEHACLGYIVRLGGKAVYHSGDCVPYAGLPERLARERIDVALLPVNGRGASVPGNFTFGEAETLCRTAGIPVFVAHHFGMFAFNSVTETELERQVSAVKPGLRVILPRLHQVYPL